MDRLGRRPACPDDEAFLRALDAQTRGALFAGWEPDAVAQMLALQYDARRAARRGAREEIVVLEGTAVGALVSTDGGDGLHILDLALVPEARGRGIGSALLADLLSAQPSARVEVEATNQAARRFYERAGFDRDGDGDGVTITLRRASRRASR
jgi:ribosomal protein S18 acetylase RimI-like enzyme